VAQHPRLLGKVRAHEDPLPRQPRAGRWVGCQLQGRVEGKPPGNAAT